MRASRGSLALGVIVAWCVGVAGRASAGDYVTSKGTAEAWLPAATFTNDAIELEVRTALVMAWRLDALVGEPLVECVGGWVLIGDGWVRRVGDPGPRRKVPEEVLRDLRLVSVAVRADVIPGSNSPLMLHVRCDLGAMAPPLRLGRGGFVEARKLIKKEGEAAISYNTPGSPSWSNLFFQANAPIAAEAAKRRMRSPIKLRLVGPAWFVDRVDANLHAVEGWLADQEQKEIDEARTKLAEMTARRNAERAARDQLTGNRFWEVADDPTTVADQRATDAAKVAMARQDAARKLASRANADRIALQQAVADKRKAVDLLAKHKGRLPTQSPPTEATASPTSAPAASSPVDSLLARFAAFGTYPSALSDDFVGAGDNVQLSAHWNQLLYNVCDFVSDCPKDKIVQIEIPRCGISVDVRGPSGRYTFQYPINAFHDLGVDHRGMFAIRRGQALPRWVPASASGSPSRTDLEQIAATLRGRKSQCVAHFDLVRRITAEERSVAGASSRARSNGLLVHERDASVCNQATPCIHLDAIWHK